MATLQKIRNRGGLMVAIVIGLALGAFILGDMLNSGSKLMKPSQMKIAEINGESIQYPEFQKKIEELSEIYKMNSQKNQIDENTGEQIREQVWQQYLQDNIIGKASEELGVTVTSQELFDLIQGNNPHPIIQQLFANPQTGTVDKAAIIKYLKTLDSQSPERKAYWLFVEKQIKQDRQSTKYNDLISKGLYVTTQEAKQSLQDKNKNTNIQFVALNYSTIADATVNVSDSELKAYYNTHKDEYKEEKTRTFDYVAFEVTPSAADVVATQKWINDSKNDLVATTDNAQYINANSDVSFNPSFNKKEELSAELANWAFSAQVGSIYGPYLENNEYKLAKIDQFKMLPDSVQASHILIDPNKVGSVEKAKALADSLKRKIDLGGSFAEMAAKYSDDPGSKIKGGELGWFKRKQMVPEFEDAAFSGEINKLYVVETRYGYHIIKPTKKGKETNQVRLAILCKKIEPSTQTYQNVYTEAGKFASENQTADAFNKAVVTSKLTKKTAVLKESDTNVLGLEQSRQLVRAAFTVEKGQMLVNNEGSSIFEFGNKFVIGIISGATEEGPSSFEDAKPRVELAVRQDKKAQMLVEKMKNAASGQSNMEGIASKLSTDIKLASAVNFTSYSIPAVGFEPALVGAVCTLSEGKISEPIIGKNGVYIAKVMSVSTSNNNDLKGEKSRLAQTLSSRASSSAFESLKKMTEIVDKRSKFY